MTGVDRAVVTVEKALNLYQKLSKVQKNRVPEALRTWLNYRSEKYFGENRKGNGAGSKG